MSKEYRFIDQRGDFNVVRRNAPRAVWGDLYHKAIMLRWRWFLSALAGAYATIHLLFGTLYWLGAPCIEGAREGVWLDGVWFSVQTLTTIGYGAMSPATTYAHAIVALEAFVAIVSVAIVTGLLFAKFSLPTARVLFSERAVIAPFEGKNTLMFRMANMRANQIVDATLHVSLARFETTQEGERYRRFVDMQMVRSATPMFVLSWTAMHVIDASSPLYELDERVWNEGQYEIMISITGVDGTFGQSIHARYSYTHDDIDRGHHFEDVISMDADRRLVLDYEPFHHTRPIT